MSIEVSRHAQQHRGLGPLALRARRALSERGSVEVEHPNRDAIVRDPRNQVVGMQVRMAQPRTERGIDDAPGLAHDGAAQRRVLPDECRNRLRIVDELGQQTQAMRDSGATAERPHRPHDRHAVPTEPVEDYQLPLGAPRLEVPVAEEPTEHAAAPIVARDDPPPLDLEDAHASPALHAVQGFSVGPELLERNVREFLADQCRAARAIAPDEGVSIVSVQNPRPDVTPAVRFRIDLLVATELPHGSQVLVVRLSALGDVLFALETVAALAEERPDVQIDFLVEDRFEGVLRGHPQIRRVIVYPRKRKWRLPGFFRSLRKVEYDVVLDLHGILKSAVPVRFCRAKTKLGFAPGGAREGAHRAYDVAVPLPEPLPHRADRGYALLRELGLAGAPAQPILPPPDVEPEFWHRDDRRRVLIHPGASAFAAFKRWPVDKHAALARSLVDRGHDVAISFGPGERELAERVLAAAPGTRPLDGTALGLLGLAAVMADAHLVVAADTGPLHIAAATGTRVVALFGPKDHRLYGPRGHGHEVLFHEVPCRPCKRRTCASPQCILGLELDTVERAVEHVLASV